LIGADPVETRRRLTREAGAARELHGRSRIATPEHVAIGDPGAGYPLPWSVQTWLPGTDATVQDPGGSTAFAHDLAVFIRDVRAFDTRGRTLSGSGRGGHLPDHDEWMRTRFEHSEPMLDVAPLRRLWAKLRALPRGAGGDVTVRAARKRVSTRRTPNRSPRSMRG
jgi:aminoglycoside phosphotransferase (APT) family kinase protein